MKIRQQSGIALLEAMLAAIILGIGLLGTIGLQARSYSALAEAEMRAEATIAADKLVGMIVTDQASADSYALAANGTPDERLQDWYDETRTLIPGATITVDITPVAGTTRRQVNIEISWVRKAGAAPNKHNVTAYVSQST
jgi:type IV pilus assembly protein PilV